MKTLHELFTPFDGFFFSFDSNDIIVDHVLPERLQAVFPTDIENFKTGLVEMFPSSSPVEEWLSRRSAKTHHNENIWLGKLQFHVVLDFSEGYLLGIPVESTSSQVADSAISEAHRLVQMKTNFINVVSHELRTPLAGIQSSLDLLRLRFKNQLPQEVYEYLGKIELQTSRMSQMMRDVLDMNRLGLNDSELEISELDTRQQILEIVDYLLSTKHYKRKVSFHMQPDPVIIHTDERGFSTMFTNLIDNALKFSPKGNVHVYLESVKGGCIIKIVDTGVGIPKEDQERLFQSFYRGSNANSFEGTGLGLVIVKRYTELLGGTIDLQSEPGNTEFTVYLPDLATQEPPTLNTFSSAK